MLFKEGLILCLMFGLGTLQAQEVISPGAIDQLDHQAKAMEKQMKITDIQENKNQVAMPSLADLDRAYKQQMASLRKTMFGAPNRFAGKQINQAHPASPSAGAPVAGERIYVLISSSVPTLTLRNLLSDVGRINDARVRVVLRGMVKDDMTQTYRWIRNVAMREPGCHGSGCRMLAPIDLDPNPFRDFSISKVPALVWSSKRADGFGTSPKEFQVIYGDSSLKYNLERFQSARRGTLPSALLRRLEQRDKPDDE